MRLLVVSKNKVPRKIPKKVCGRHVCILYVFWEWGEGVTEKGKEIAVYILPHIFIAASILNALSQLGAYSFFIQSMCFLMSLNYAGCNVFFFSLLILFLGKHLVQ